MPELLIVLGIVLILLSIALPLVQNSIQSYRLMGDVRGIEGQLNQARVRAESNFTKTEVFFDTTGQSYQVQIWMKSSGLYEPDGGAQPLSQGNAFGYGTLTTPAGGQSGIAQTTPMFFNSRGVVTDAAGNPTGNSAIYITNNQGNYCAVAVSLTGTPSAWKWNGSAWVRF
jgi:Tfp pilus assembly protein FimT